jgi:hypothetical protein
LANFRSAQSQNLRPPSLTFLRLKFFASTKNTHTILVDVGKGCAAVFRVGTGYSGTTIALYGTKDRSDRERSDPFR